MSDKTWIKKLKVDHYGPIGGENRNLDPGLNVFYGRNESGKTLLVESITKMLLDDSSGFQGIGRVPQEPAGMMVAESGGEEFEVSQEKLESMFKDATAEDIRNAFIIRDFDLRLPEIKNDFGTDGYFSNVTDRILGSKTQKIQDLRDEISDIGLLTNASLDKNPGLTNSKNGRGKLKDKRREAENLSEDIETFRSKELKGQNILNKYSRLNTIEDELDELKEKERKLAEAEKKQKYQESLQLVKELEKAIKKSEEIEKRERKREKLQDIKEAIIKAKEIDEPVKGLDKEIASVSLIATFILAIASLSARMVFIGFLAALTSSIYFGKRYRSTQAQIQEKESTVNQILNKLKAEGLDAENLQEAEKEIKDFKQELEDERRENDRDKQDKESKLEGKFDRSGESLEEWKDIVESFSGEFEDTDLNYSEEKVEEVKREKQELEAEKQEKEKELEKYTQKINDFNSRFQRVPVQKFTDHSELEIETVDDLPEARRQLEDFIKHLEETVESSRKAIEILEEMEQSEEDEFNKVFKEDSYAVKMFQEATDGNYTDIMYQKSNGTLKVERRDGQVLSPEQLSQGTYDLLYMSIRLKLAKEILGEPGFLVLDNAFVHSDIERVEKEIEFLQQLEDDGWQIIYFTFRDDVKERLEEITDVKKLEKLEY